jgi:hypothetical protein
MLSYRFLPLLILSTAFFPTRDKYCVLIILNPRWSIATYLDTGSSSNKKDYTRIKGVLDEALEGYAQMGGHFEQGQTNGECFSLNNKHRFRHGTQFDCMKQKHGSVKDAFYVLHLMKGFVRDALKTKLPSSIREWTKNAGKIAEDKLREDFHLIQMELSRIIYDDVVTAKGTFNKASGRINHAYSQ